LDGEISTSAAGREGSCLAAVAAAELNEAAVDIAGQARGNKKRTRGHGDKRSDVPAGTLGHAVMYVRN
jgi:hypothetical protein